GDGERRRSRQKRLEGAVQIEIVLIALRRRGTADGRAGLRRLIVHANPVRLGYAACVGCQRVVDADAWTDGGAAFGDDVKEIVIPDDAVDAYSGIDRQARHRPPRVLNVNGVILTGASQPFVRRRVDDDAVERGDAGGEITRLPQHRFFENEAAIRVVV